jgi:hypothetical protein
MVALPYPLTLSFDLSKTITHFTCHKLLVGISADVIGKMVSSGLQHQVISLGGCFAFRAVTYGHETFNPEWGLLLT